MGGWFSSEPEPQPTSQWTSNRSTTYESAPFTYASAAAAAPAARAAASRPASSSLESSLAKLRIVEDSDTPAYLLSVTKSKCCFFTPSSEKLKELPRSQTEENLTKDQLYWSDGKALRAMKENARAWYSTARARTVYDEAAYARWIVPALLLGSRVRDYEQRCARVEQLEPFVLVVQQQNCRLKKLRLKTENGYRFNMIVTGVHKETDKTWRVFAEPEDLTQGPPRTLRINALLEIENLYAGPSRVATALATYRQPAGNWPLLKSLYGRAAGRVHDAPSSEGFEQVRLADNGGFMTLNPEQAEAVARYNSSCPCFVVESPPGSGKTATAAAMAVSYKGEGVQLFLSTGNVPVFNMAIALAKLDYGELKAIHFVSQEREELMTEETMSPFSVISLARKKDILSQELSLLEEALAIARTDEDKAFFRQQIQLLTMPILWNEYDIMFATIDMILGHLLKPSKNPKKPGAIKKALQQDVRRIVVDEASQLTEAALNALIICFPNAKICLIGDSKQLPPFRYEKDDLVSSLCSRSALEVVKDKRNVPVITLNRVYRASMALSKHYSDAFYDGQLVSLRLQSIRNPLDFFGQAGGGARCLHIEVNGYQKQAGTSKVNHEEINKLIALLRRLRAKGYDEKSVMIISYYEAQRRLAENRMRDDSALKGYELLTIDSAQGREKKIVIVLTTRTCVPTDQIAFFSCPKRCNVAVSRHQEALVVLGHPSIAAAPNWSAVLSPKYFKTIKYF